MDMAAEYTVQRKLSAKLAGGSLSIISPSGTGSGVRVCNSIVTAAHVILPDDLLGWDQAGSKYNVGCVDRRTECKLLAYHKDYDIAILEPTNIKDINLFPRFDISSDAHIGDPIWVGGYPFSTEIPVVRRGCIASIVMPDEAMIVDRNMFTSNSTLFPSYWIDIPIFPGNSGGPVLNENGDLIGIALQTLQKNIFIPDQSGDPEKTNVVPIYMDIGIALRLDVALPRTGLDKVVGL